MDTRRPSKKDLNRIIDLARWAPSSHNTQPWTVALNEGGVVIGYDPARHLKVGDPDKRELYLSLGCFIESFAVAAGSMGWRMDVAYVGKPPGEVASLKVEPISGKSAMDASLLTKRRSDRREFIKKPVPAADIKKLGALNEGGAAVYLSADSQVLNFLADMTYESTLELMTPAPFRAELSRWIRHNWTRRPDGMPGYVQGIPGPISLVGHKLVKNVAKTAADQAKKDAKRIRQSAAAALVITKGETKADWLDAGRLFQRLWLSAAGLGISGSAVSPAVIATSTSRQITEKLKLAGTPVALLRLGYSDRKTPKASPRLGAEQIIRS